MKVPGFEEMRTALLTASLAQISFITSVNSEFSCLDRVFTCRQQTSIVNRELRRQQTSTSDQVLHSTTIPSESLHRRQTDNKKPKPVVGLNRFSKPVGAAALQPFKICLLKIKGLGHPGKFDQQPERCMAQS